MYALASNVTGAGSVESRSASSAKYAAAAGKPPPYRVSSPTRTSGRSTGEECCSRYSAATSAVPTPGVKRSHRPRDAWPRPGVPTGSGKQVGTARGAAPSARERSERVTDAPGDGRERLGRRRAGIGRDDRPAGVREIGQLRLQRYLTEQWDAKLVREPGAAAGAKDLRALTAVGAHEVAHVFDHAQHRDADALEHLRAAQRIPHRHFLRRGDDDRGADVHGLGERQLRVARPRRQVPEKVVELSPVHVFHELLDHLHDDRPTPDGGRVPLDDE